MEERFSGQRLSGKLFGVDGVVTLPTFDYVEEDADMTAGEEKVVSFMIDVWAHADESSGERWIVKTELFSPLDEESISQLKRYGDLLGAKSWLIVFDKILPQTRNLAKKFDVMLSGMSDWKAIKKAL